MKQPLLLIHGINSRGDWYPDVQLVMRHHFACQSSHYDQFENDWFGFRVALDSWARDAALKKLKRGSLTVSQLQCACVIAHSLGTYMTWRLLKDGHRLGRLIFIGSVLNPETDWSALAQGFEGLLNEMAKKDDVAGKAAPFLGVFNRDFGSAGADGFRSSDATIHDVTADAGSCRLCSFGTRRGDARVHNVRVPGDFKHSTATEGRIRAENMWLPFLLGLIPAEARAFTDFVRAADQCLTRAGLEESAGESLPADHLLLREFAQTCDSFMSVSWNWCAIGGHSITAWEFLEYHLVAACRRMSVTRARIDEFRALAVHRVVQLGMNAIDGIQGAVEGADPATDDKARCITPAIAFARACRRAARDLGLADES
jgi:pimeloyl-ACP methyl ester carboxylesterase